MSDFDEKVTFCSACFATNENGSWGANGWSVQEVEERGQNCYCINCAGHGEILIMSRGAASQIRRSSSWVGKRYYPCNEDLLHSLIVNDSKGSYRVQWQFKEGVKTLPEGIRPWEISGNEAFEVLKQSLLLYETLESTK